MQFKFDENLHNDVTFLLREHGYDAMTVVEQGLRGYPDRQIAVVCREEKRAIITLDLDFADIRQYPPQNYAGIIVLRLSDQCRSSVLRVIKWILPLITTEPLERHLWIVEDDRLRIRGIDIHCSIGPE